MSNIKYNEFGEVISVNGLTTGHHIGTPMQDAIAEKPEDNQNYATQLGTVTKCENTVVDYVPSVGGNESNSNSKKTYVLDILDDGRYVVNKELYDLIIDKFYNAPSELPEIYVKCESGGRKRIGKVLGYYNEIIQNKVDVIRLYYSNCTTETRFSTLCASDKDATRAENYDMA